MSKDDFDRLLGGFKKPDGVTGGVQVQTTNALSCQTQPGITSVNTLDQDAKLKADAKAKMEEEQRKQKEKDETQRTNTSIMEEEVGDMSYRQKKALGLEGYGGGGGRFGGRREAAAIGNLMSSIARDINREGDLEQLGQMNPGLSGAIKDMGKGPRGRSV